MCQGTGCYLNIDDSQGTQSMEAREHQKKVGEEVLPAVFEFLASRVPTPEQLKSVLQIVKQSQSSVGLAPATSLLVDAA